MELKILLKNTSYLAGTRLVKFIAGVFRSKINAVFLGTDGVGIIQQFMMMIKTSSEFTTLGMNEAVVKQIAQSSAEGTNENFASSVKTYLITVSFFLIFSMILLFLFRTQIAVYVFGGSEYLGYFFIAMLTFPLLIINGVFFAILKGFKAIKHIAGASIGIIVTNLCFFIPLVSIYKLEGAIAYLPISFLVTIGWNFYFAKRYYMDPHGLTLKSIWHAPIMPSYRKEMLVFSGFGIVVSLLSMLSVFVGRSIVVTNLGVAKIGVYAPIVTWAGLFTGFLLPSFNTYLFPRFSEVKSNEEATGIINDALRLSTFSLLPLLFLAIPFRNILIQVFYSREFLEAAEYLPYHFVGVIFNVWFVVFGQSMTPRGFIKQQSVFRSCFFLLGLVLAIVLVPKFGLYGWMLKFTISCCCLFLANFIFLSIKTDFRLRRENMLLMFYLLMGSVLLIIVDQYVHSNVMAMVLGPLLLIFSYLLLSKQERSFLMSKVKSK